MEAGECEPGLVPQEDQVGLDGKAFLHHPLDVVHNTVERAVGEHEDLDPVKLARSPERQQRPLDLPDRDPPVHVVLVDRVRIEIGDVRAGVHQTVVVRLVTVAVDQHNVVGLDERLHDDLVRRRGTVGHEERPAGAERLGRETLCVAKRPGRFQQRVEPSAGGRRLRKEDIQPVEGRHVIDPVRVDDRLPARNGKCVEHARRLVAVFAQRGEERRPIALADSAQQAEVELKRALPGVENAAEVPAELGRDLLDRCFSHQIKVELGADLVDPLAEPFGQLAGRQVAELMGKARADEITEGGQVVPRLHAETLPDDAGLQVEVKEHRRDGVLAAGYHDQLIDEVVAATVPAAASCHR